MSYNSDLETVRVRAEQQGFRYRRTERNHHQFYAPDGKTIVTTAGTPGDERGWRNFMADMARAGYEHEFKASTMAEALQSAGVAAGKSAWSVTQLVMDFMSRHPKSAQLEDIIAFVRSVRPSVPRNGVQCALSELIVRNRLSRPRRGVYALPETAPPRTDPTDAERLTAALAALREIELIVRRTQAALAFLQNSDAS